MESKMMKVTFCVVISLMVIGYSSSYPVPRQSFEVDSSDFGDDQNNEEQYSRMKYILQNYRQKMNGLTSESAESKFEGAKSAYPRKVRQTIHYTRFSVPNLRN